MTHDAPDAKGHKWLEIDDVISRQAWRMKLK